jgi:hypothetical protein
MTEFEISKKIVNRAEADQDIIISLGDLIATKL